jgi:uncharacterized protein (TIGR03437 family)
VRLLALVLACAALLVAQSGTDWRKVGGSAVELSLAAPATGPVDQVWFSPAGSVLYARTRGGSIYQTADFETWIPAGTPPAPPPALTPQVARIPEIGAHFVANALPAGRIYSLGRNLFRSEDGGRTWTNLTAYRSTPVVGGAQHSLAISPVSPDFLVIANDFGVWRSLDGGLSWSGLNQFLPNLSVRRIVSAPSGSAGTRALAEGLGMLELPPGGSVWVPVAPSDTDARTRQRLSVLLNAEVTALAASGQTVYAGGTEGRMWVSLDGGITFRTAAMPLGAAGRVERIFADPMESWIALAVLSGRGPHVLRTTNRAAFWDSIDGNLPDVPAHGVTADRAASAVYVATDRGVYWATADLETASTAAVEWTALSDRLPAAAANDVLLDPAGVQLYAALEGYGVYAVAAPHRRNSLRVVNAGDYSTRPAAPGSLLSIIGGRVLSIQGGNLRYPVFASSDAESQVQVPFEAVGPVVSLSVQTDGRTVRRDLPVQPVSPVIMVARDGAPMLWDAETGMPLDQRTGSHRSAKVQIWATGLGKVRPEWPTGTEAPLENPPEVVAEVKAYLDGVALPVTRATLVPGFIGFYLIEVQLPAIVNSGVSELWISAAGTDSNRVALPVEQ